MVDSESLGVEKNFIFGRHGWPDPTAKRKNRLMRRQKLSSGSYRVIAHKFSFGVTLILPNPDGSATRYLPAIRMSDVDDYGHLAAHFIARLRKWIAFNKLNHDGPEHFDGKRTWSYSSHESIAADLRMTARQVRRIVDKLSKAGVIRTACRSRNSSDRILWYAFNDEPRFLSDQTVTPYDRTVTSPSDRTVKSSITTREPIRDTTRDGRSDDFSLLEIPEGSLEGPDAPNDLRTLKIEKGEKEPKSESRGPVYLVNTEGGNMSEDTKTRNNAFAAMQSGKAKAAPEDDRRGDLARRQGRDDRAGKPRKGRPGPEAAPRPRQSLRSPVYEAWRDAMAKLGLSPGPVVEQRDVQDAERLLANFAGNEVDAMAFAVWTVESWGLLTKRFPELEEKYVRTFSIISSRWYRSLHPMWLKAKGTSVNGGSAEVKGSPEFRAYMALTAEQKAEENPQKVKKINDTHELMDAVDAYWRAKEEVWEKKQSAG